MFVLNICTIYQILMDIKCPSFPVSQSHNSPPWKQLSRETEITLFLIHMFVYSIDMIALYILALLSLFLVLLLVVCLLTEQSTLEIIPQQTNQIGSFQYKKWWQIEIIMGVITVQAYQNESEMAMEDLVSKTPLCTTENWNFLWTVAGPRTPLAVFRTPATCHLMISSSVLVTVQPFQPQEILT